VRLLELIRQDLIPCPTLAARHAMEQAIGDPCPCGSFTAL
jgi:hypothetical protein